MAGQFLVQVQGFNDTAARQQMRAPVVPTRSREDVRSVTLTVPLAENRRGRGVYLVMQLPREEVRRLMERARSLPEAERQGFIRNWLQRNQEAAVSRYLEARGGGRPPRQFRVDTVPVPAAEPSAREAVPRRAEGPARPRVRERAPEPEPVELDQLVIRRRTAEVETPEIQETPIPPQFRARRTEGRGTRESPLVVEIPIPAGNRAGEPIHETSGPIIYTLPNGRTNRLQITARFVGAEPLSGEQTTSRRQLAQQLEMRIVSGLRRYLREEENMGQRDVRNITGGMRRNLRQIARRMVDSAAGAEDEISEYAPR
ncbi:hypothetical protein GF318_05415 [Candidatus Micrarchaeota archaeon]|nr:hypothetical protein [Candidatus Micrarchaeota archaeon]